MTMKRHPGELDLVVDVHKIEYGDVGPPGSTSDVLEDLSRPESAGTDPGDVMVVTSLRLPVRLLRQLREHAEQHNSSPSELMRQWIELHTAESDRLISLGEALRAIASLRSAA